MFRLEFRLAKVMASKNVSVNEACRRLKAIGVDSDRSTVNRHKKGQHDFSIVENYCNVLGCVPADLLVLVQREPEQPTLPMPP